MKRTYWLGLTVLVAGTALWGLSRVFTPIVAGERVSRGDVIYVVSGSVTVSAEAETPITCPQDGKVKESNLVEGKTVQAGDLLLRLDPGDLPIKEEQDQAALDDVEKHLADKLPSEITLQNMQSDLAKEKTLIDSGLGGLPAKYEDDQRSVQAQEIATKEERSGLETQQKTLQISIQMDKYQLSLFEIDAPYNGTITAVSAHAGDQLSKGAPVANLVSRDLRIESQVDQDDIAAVQENEKADIQFFAYPGKSFTAKVTKVLPSSDKLTQRFTVLLELVDPTINLVAGLTGEVGYSAGKHENVLWIPRRALYNNSVFVVTNGRIEIRPVNPGYETLTQAEILPSTNPHATVSEGDVVLTENLDLFRNGDRVRVNLPANPTAQ
jgi:RND family efflux transporter MFP subunit